MEEYGIMEYLVIRCGRWMGNREFIWTGLMLHLQKSHLCSYIITFSLVRVSLSLVPSTVHVLCNILIDDNSSCIDDYVDKVVS